MINNFYVDNLVVGAEEVDEAKKIYAEAKRIMLKGGMNLREWIFNSSEFNNSIPAEDKANESTINVLKLWKQGIGWDSTPSPEVITEWTELHKQLSLLSNVTIPQRLIADTDSQLHVFVDASATLQLLICVTLQTINTIRILYAARVCPIKSVTIPRLELQAAVLGCELANFISKTYPMCKIQIWSDSQVVLYCIQNRTQKQGPFVSNRIRDINDYNYNFRYCPTKENPADFPSRGITTHELIDSDFGLHGPKWLNKADSSWPKDVTNSTPPSIPRPAEPLLMTTHHEMSFPFDIDPSRYSSFGKLLRITAFCQRFVNRIRQRQTTNGPVQPEEYDSSQILWIKCSQSNNFEEQLKLLKSKGSDTTIRNMSLYLDNNVIRCRRRISKAVTTHEGKHPILLPKNNIFTNLSIKDIHSRTYHDGVRHTLSILRQSYWLPNGRQQVRFILKRCLVCKLWEGQSYSNPPPPPLPFLMVTKSPAISCTGCDFAGPLYVYTGPQTTKAYICLFTCAVTRAVHLEVVEDLTTSSFLIAFRRFVSRRGVPIEIISDNAKTFKLAKSVIDKIQLNFITAENTVNYIRSQHIKWIYSVERAPWLDGFFERMVGLTKRTLLKAMGKANLSVQELSTFLAEVEAIFNSCPLTFVYNELQEDRPLCPQHFLSDARFFGFPTKVLRFPRKMIGIFMLKTSPLRHCS